MTDLVPNVTGREVAMWLGRDGDLDWTRTQGQMFADTSREAASAYVGGVGFEDPAKIPQSLHFVIRMRAVRMAINYSQVISEGADSLQTMYGAAGQGFTLQELDALDTYRPKSA